MTDFNNSQTKDMKNFDTRTYSVSDFIEWHGNGLLELSPDFQRRSVWTEKAKSYLIDTIVRGKPFPKIILLQSLEGGRNKRIVVDGQQRLRTILEFYDSSFKLNRVHNKEYGNSYYDDLPVEVQNEFKKYELGVDVLFETTYEDLLDIFARINSYTVRLNKQELFNATYVGFFKHAAFSYGIKYVNYLLTSSVLTKASVTRMSEVELASDFLVALLGGVQTNKNVENFYKKYEETAGKLPAAGKQFDAIMSYIGTIYPSPELSGTNWKRIHLFYTLFTSIGHLLYGIEGLNPNYRFKINEKTIPKLRIALDSFSARFDQIAEDLNNEHYPKDFKKFITWSRRGTTDTSARSGRSNFLCKYLKASMSK